MNKCRDCGWIETNRSRVVGGYCINCAVKKDGGILVMANWTDPDAWWNKVGSLPEHCFELFPKPYEFSPYTPKACECGQKGVEHAKHSDYCPLYAPNRP